MRLPLSTPRPELEALIEQAKHRPPMTPAELQAQRISFASGMLPEGSTASREDVAAADYAKYGNLAAIQARLAAAEAMAEALRFADEVFRDLGWHAKWEVTTAALEKWRAGK